MYQCILFQYAPQFRIKLLGHGTQRQPHIARHKTHHADGGFDRNGIGLQEHGAVQRQQLMMYPAGLLPIARLSSPNHGCAEPGSNICRDRNCSCAAHRHPDDHPATDRHTDAHALHALEFAAGVFIDAPRGGLLFSGAARQLTLASAAPVAPDTFLRLLRQADRSYESLPGGGLAAVNKSGFQVRLLRPPAAPSGHRMPARDASGVTVPADMGDLAALLAAPKFSQVVIGRRGDPVTMVVPDPRALALHRLWLSQRQDREPADKDRDRVQAAALAELILRYLPQYDFFSAELQLFPPQVARLAENLVEGYEMAADLETD